MHNSVSPRLNRKLVFKFCLALGIIVIIVNTLVINFVLHFPSQHYSITVAALNTTAGLATIYGFVTIYRYGFRGTHGRSLLYLTIGILFWLLADLSLAYGHFVQHHEEEQALVVSLADLYWIIGYVFFSLHLFTAIRLVRRDQVHKFSVAMVVIASGLIIVYNLILPSGFYASQEGRIIGETKTGVMDLILSILYPILDLVLIIPSVIILTVHRKDYYNFMPWILSSLSILVNAIADDGFVHHFLEGNTKEIWIWDLFFMTDYIILIGAFYWYNRFSDKLKIER
ncbi:MAG: hypothetical protein WAM26_12570 [Nitrososphaeraceae archaeon]